MTHKKVVILFLLCIINWNQRLSFHRSTAYLQSSIPYSFAFFLVPLLLSDYLYWYNDIPVPSVYRSVFSSVWLQNWTWNLRYRCNLNLYNRRTVFWFCWVTGLTCHKTTYYLNFLPFQFFRLFTKEAQSKNHASQATNC